MVRPSEVKKFKIPTNIQRRVLLVGLSSSRDYIDEFLAGLKMNDNIWAMPEIQVTSIHFDPAETQDRENPERSQALSKAIRADTVGFWIDHTDLTCPAANRVWSFFLERLHQFHVPKENWKKDTQLYLSGDTWNAWEKVAPGTILYEAQRVAFRRQNPHIIGDVKNTTDGKGAHMLGSLCSIGLQFHKDDRPKKIAEAA